MTVAAIFPGQGSQSVGMGRALADASPEARAIWAEADALAVESPALQTPRRFAPGVVNRLVTDLAQVRVQQPDGSFLQQTGLHVEPIHLQVVCVGLWDRMAPDDLTIDEGDLATFGDVGDALKGYYETAVGNVSAGSAGRERAIRDWFEERLISPDGVRRQVLRGVDQSEGLPNGEIAALLDTYLVRAEPRAGATWYELAHDRLIRPVRESNAAWRETHLSELQRAAELWERGGRPDGMLLRGDTLDAALVWSRDHAQELTEIERELVEKSESARTAGLKARRASCWHGWPGLCSSCSCLPSARRTPLASGRSPRKR